MKKNWKPFVSLIYEPDSVGTLCEHYYISIYHAGEMQKINNDIYRCDQE